MTVVQTILRCPSCGRSPLSYNPGAGANCVSCNSSFPEERGVLDLLGDPEEAVVTELRGLAAENRIDFDALGPQGVKMLHVTEIETTSMLMDSSRSGRVQYYQQTASAYFEALARAQVDSHMRVAEVGAERTLWKLRVIEDLCDESYGLNIFFHVGENVVPPTKAVRVLGDMNNLPFLTESLDLLLYSATLHHSSQLEGALTEAGRVLVPGGRAIVVNEPIAGVAKGLGGCTGHDRDESIHEDDVPFRDWKQAIKRSGLVPDHFVPAWFLGQVRNGKHLPQGTRFRQLGGALAPLARRSGIGDVMRATARIPAQAGLGLPLNAVLWKQAK